MVLKTRVVLIKKTAPKRRCFILYIKKVSIVIHAYHLQLNQFGNGG